MPIGTAQIKRDPGVDATSIQGVPVSTTPPTAGQTLVYDGGTGEYVPLTITGLTYKGLWDANTNTPVLGNGGAGGVAGDYYVVSVAGTTSLDGINSWQINDWVINNGSAWQKIDNTSLVKSVNGKVGVVVLAHSDLTDKEWSKSSHTMDADLDMNSQKITECTAVEGPAASDAGVEAGAGFGVYSKLGDAVGATKHKIVDSSDVEVAAIDSDGNLTLAGTVDGVDVAGHASNSEAHHKKLELFSSGNVAQSSKKVRTEQVAYTNGGNTITFGAGVFANKPTVSVTLELNGLADSIYPLVAKITALNNLSVTIKCYKATLVGFFIVYAECANNDVNIHMTAIGD